MKRRADQTDGMRVVAYFSGVGTLLLMHDPGAPNPTPTTWSIWLLYTPSFYLLRTVYSLQITHQSNFRHHGKPLSSITIRYHGAHCARAADDLDPISNVLLGHNSRLNSSKTMFLSTTSPYHRQPSQHYIPQCYAAWQPSLAMSAQSTPYLFAFSATLWVHLVHKH